MYQSLIWLTVLRDETRGLAPARNLQDVQGLANSLVHGVRRNSELDCDLLGRQMLRDELEAFELAAIQLRHAVSDHWLSLVWKIVPERGIRHPSFPFIRCLLPRPDGRVRGNLRQNGPIGQGQRVIFR
jgi:hypothetical protein